MNVYSDQHPHMIVAGLFDGNIAVYNLQKNTGRSFHTPT